MAKHWIQKATKKMKENGTKGSFTRAATERGETTRELDENIQAHPDKYSKSLRKKDQFFHNVVK